MTLKSPRTNTRKKIFTVDETDVQTKIELKTLHFNFTDLFAKELAAFAEIHRNDDRKVFKSAWNDWIETASIAQLVSTDNPTRKNQAKAIHLALSAIPRANRQTRTRNYQSKHNQQ